MKNYFAYFAMILLVWSCQPTNQKEAIPEKTQTSAWGIASLVKVDSLNPILKPDQQLSFTCPIAKKIVQWESRNVLNPAAVVKGDSVYLFYRAQDATGTSRIGLAVSGDGLHFTKRPQPVFFPDEDDMKKYEWNYRKQADTPMEDCVNCYFDGVEDPRIIASETGTYIMTYTSYDGKTARLCIASSTNLLNWKKHGLVLKDEKYADLWSKSGAIVGELRGNNVIAQKINGKYWMYFGDTHLFMASSDDLLNWQVAVNEESGKMISVLHPRMGYFDSRLVEPGPYALLRDEGILLIYNSSNAQNFNDPNLPKFTYAAGQALFDKTAPYKMIDRKDSYFIKPDKDYEKMGEVNEVCFVEGLVYFKDLWYLYYGTADSRIAVGVCGF
jgi:beta-1,2-mannosidase